MARAGRSTKHIVGSAAQTAKTNERCTKHIVGRATQTAKTKGRSTTIVSLMLALRSTHCHKNGLQKRKTLNCPPTCMTVFRNHERHQKPAKTHDTLNRPRGVLHCTHTHNRRKHSKRYVLFGDVSDDRRHLHTDSFVHTMCN